MKTSDHDNRSIEPVVETWRLSVGTSTFSIEIRADGSWQPFVIASLRLGGWTLRALLAAAPTDDVDAAVRAWGRQYGANLSIRREPRAGFC